VILFGVVSRVISILPSPPQRRGVGGEVKILEIIESN